MSDVAIRVSGLSKQYTIGTKYRSYRTLRETMVDTCARPIRALRSRWNGSAGQSNGGGDTIWALKDIDLEIKRGEVIGVIGRNGAGKSTLLKVLSRITEPSDGFADIHGRVGSLLEVGTGFHGELTGRENIYLNGAILGMKRGDIDRKFDSIVAFAEVEKFIDTPVKHYSSGMYLRLAFAVAAHLEPEILLVDEVLAVGDAAFQSKCLGKMGDVAKEGRTILFVSHNMGAVRSLCQKGVVLNGGGVDYQGDIGKSIEMYYKMLAERAADDTGRPKSGFGFGPISLVSHPSSTIDQGEPFEVETTLFANADVAGVTVLCLLEDVHQRGVFHLRKDSSAFSVDSWRGAHHICVKIPPLWLEPGVYNLYFKAFFWGQLAQARYVSDSFHLDVGGESSGWSAVLTPRAEWSVAKAEVEQ